MAWYFENDNNSLSSMQTVIINVAWYLCKQGDYFMAQKMITEALVVLERILEPNDVWTC